MNINEVKPGDTLATRDSGSSYTVITITGNNITLSHDEIACEIDVFLRDLPEMFVGVEAERPSAAADGFPVRLTRMVKPRFARNHDGRDNRNRMD